MKYIHEISSLEIFAKLKISLCGFWQHLAHEWIVKSVTATTYFLEMPIKPMQSTPNEEEDKFWRVKVSSRNIGHNIFSMWRLWKPQKQNCGQWNLQSSRSGCVALQISHYHKDRCLCILSLYLFIFLSKALQLSLSSHVRCVGEWRLRGVFSPPACRFHQQVRRSLAPPEKTPAVLISKLHIGPMINHALSRRHIDQGPVGIGCSVLSFIVRYWSCLFFSMLCLIRSVCLVRMEQGLESNLTDQAHPGLVAAQSQCPCGNWDMTSGSQVCEPLRFWWPQKRYLKIVFPRSVFSSQPIFGVKFQVG